MEIMRRLQANADRLTRSDRRIAELAESSPHTIGFGTVADVAAAAGVGTATVTRFAVKLGYDGYADLQASVQADLVGRLRPAVERIRHSPGAPDVDGRRERHIDVEVANVRATLGSLDGDTLSAIAARLADIARDVVVVSGAASTGVAMQFAHDLAQLRPGVQLAMGNPVEVQRTIALASPDPSFVALDVSRYDAWVVDVVDRAAGSGAWILAVTDSVLSPLAGAAAHIVPITADATGPFDSHVGTLALLNLIVAEVASVDRAGATERLDRLEAAWTAGRSLTD